MSYIIKIDGIDGCGKTTIINELNNNFKECGYDSTIFSEFGGSKNKINTLSNKIREFIRKHEYLMDDIEYEILMTLISRRFGLYELPLMKCQYDFIIVDRSEYANYAYGLSLNASYNKIYHILLEGINVPNVIYFWLDTDIQLCIDRVNKRNEKSRNERRGMEYFKKVRSIYCNLSDEGYLNRINGNRSIESIKNEIISLIENRYKIKI